MRHNFNVALLASGDPESGGGGSTAEDFLRKTAMGLVTIDVSLIICNNSIERVPGLYARLERVKQEFGLDTEIITINGARFPAAEGEIVKPGAQTEAEATACSKAMDRNRVDRFVLTGFMKKVGNLWVKGINTHPGPISDNPAKDTKGFHGIGVQERVFELDLPYSAHTVHKVAPEYDSGQIIAQRQVLRRPDDTPNTLFDRVQDVEKACLVHDTENYLVEALNRYRL